MTRQSETATQTDVLHIPPTRKGKTRDDKSQVIVVIDSHTSDDLSEDIHSKCGLPIALTCDAQMFIYKCAK